MKIIEFPSIQMPENAALPNHPKQTTSLLFQYREAAQRESLVWSICVIAAVACIVLCLSQLQHDTNRLERTHVNRIGISQLADENPTTAELSKQL